MYLSRYQYFARSLGWGCDLEKYQVRQKYICWICGKAVDLQSCKADENGIAVHEDCYLMRVALAAESNRLAVRRPAHGVHGISGSDDLPKLPVAG